MAVVSVAAAVLRGERKGRVKMFLGFGGAGAGRVLIPRGTRPAVGSDPTARSGRRRSGHIRPKSEPSAGRFSGPGPRCGLGAGEARAERATGQFLLLGRLHSGDFQCFSIFQKHFHSILNELLYSLISIQFCTNYILFRDKCSQYCFLK